MANKATSGSTGRELPETEGLVPGGRESVGTVRRDDLSLSMNNPTLVASRSFTYAVRDDVRVTMETALGISIILFVAGQIPYDEGFVTASREQHIRAEVFVNPSFPLSYKLYTYFSSEVARLVTQPVWPTSVPRITNCSDMVAAAE